MHPHEIIAVDNNETISKKVSRDSAATLIRTMEEVNEQEDSAVVGPAARVQNIDKIDVVERWRL